ncbi:LPS export ABC transporter periplasmic protein LptC [Pseudobacteriovorax antillogorgiicola]|uniref:LPS export ABC transporter protein LptC n=1 Tax=Pseudobacteriovorax antillogorgiicola TaxID=1513793 RepID=A0A1Y6B4E8_9BACT|nr:LPS export ABC transporter periplasmic protein LptC [Pseudobacteriovorax antillogorgiicola]TCS59133.1 LPS export ABC transporter protein LptC [Pseudobacteriovorax antillogorgiicola]SME91349.1 LPS export ABC transporter protein LptC [Pseudobacteriovorax antillogorgiicola]
MGKNVVTVIFLVISSLALWVFLSREDRTLRDQVDPDAKQPRIILEEFTLYRYKKHEVQSTLTGRMAHFREPNILEVYGDIRGLRHNTEKREHFAAESATVYFNSNGIVQLMKNSEVKRCEVENNVQVGSRDSVIQTQYAQYFGAEQILRSDVPVQFTGPNSQFAGQGGFQYDIKTEDLDLIGPIEGTLQSEAIPNL